MMTMTMTILLKHTMIMMLMMFIVAMMMLMVNDAIIDYADAHYEDKCDSEDEDC